MFKLEVIAAVMVGFIAVAGTVAVAADYYVLDEPQNPCFVTARKAVEGEQQIAGPFPDAASAAARMAEIAECESVDTDPDPDK